MTNTSSRPVTSSQNEPHARLRETVSRHLNAQHQKPIADHTKDAFERIEQWIDGRDLPLILDACCGVGDSSRVLAHTFPRHLVIGVDKSAHRLAREREGSASANMLLVQADLNDLYRLFAKSAFTFDQHYILYPNPWPKPGHLGRRWHGSPAFADLIKLGNRLELRSNWPLYLEEFQIALMVAGKASVITQIFPDKPLTPFEAKYQASGQDLWQLVYEK